MKARGVDRRGTAASRRVVAAVGALALGAVGPTLAQTLPDVAPGPAGAASSATLGGPEGSYADRLLEGGGLQPQIESADPRLALRDASGWPRSMSTLTRLQSQRVAGTREDTLTTQLRASLDTPNHGALGLDASVRWLDRRRNADGGEMQNLGAPAASFALAQRQLPLAGGWSASHYLGSVATLNTPLAAPLTRLGLPTRLVNGAAGEWRQPQRGLTVQASIGNGGVYDSLGLGGLATDGSRIRVAGLQAEPSAWGGWAYAAQIESHTGARAAAPLSGTSGAAGEALWQSARWRGDIGEAARPRPAQVQLHWLVSRSAGERAQGGWLDAALDDGALSHRLGLQRLGAGAQWLGAPLSAGTESLMYRWRWRTRRDVLEAQVDLQHPTAGGGVTRQLWASGRRQLDLQDALGVQLTTLDATGGRAWQSLLYGEAVRGPNTWRGFVGAGRSAQAERLGQLGVDWSTDFEQARMGLSAALARTPGEPRAVLDTSATVSGRLSPRLTLDGSARSVWRAGGEDLNHSLSASAQWAVARGWMLEATLATSRSRVVVPLPGPSGTAPPLQGSTPTLSARTAWLGLRYDFAAGTAELPLGGAAGAGGARLEGVVFLDANANGRLDAGEARAPNVTVVLDGRYGTRTDDQGRFAFAFVASGDHELSVASDNLPLPWRVLGEAGRSIDAAPVIRVRIQARQDVRMEVGAVRDAP